MSDASSTRFSIVKQTVAGTTPTNPAWLNLNSTGPGGGSALQEAESKTIRNNRNPAPKKVVGKSSSITIPFESQYDDSGAFWRLLVASLQAGTETAATTQVTGVSGSSSSGLTTLSATGVGTAIAVGDVVRILNNSNVYVGHFRVTTGGTNTIVVDDAAEVLNGTSNLKVLRGKRARNGSTQDQFSMIRANYAPNTSTYNRFELFQLEVVDSIDLNVTAQGIITGTITTAGIGSSGFSTSDPSPGTPTYTDAPSTEVQDGTNNVPLVRIAGVDFGVQSVRFGWRQNSETRKTVGQFAADGVASGSFAGQGQISLYYDDIAELNKALEGTPSQLLVVFRDSTGASYAFSFPRIRYGNPTFSGTDQGSQIVANLPFTLDVGTDEAYGVHLEAYAS